MSKKTTITVLELIAELGKLPLEAPIIIASDEQGSAFHAFGKLEISEDGGVILWPAS